MKIVDSLPKLPGNPNATPYYDKYRCEVCNKPAKKNHQYCNDCEPLKRYEESSPDDDIPGIGNYFYEQAARRNSGYGN